MFKSDSLFKENIDFINMIKNDITFNKFIEISKILSDINYEVYKLDEIANIYGTEIGDNIWGQEYSEYIFRDLKCLSNNIRLSLPLLLELHEEIKNLILNNNSQRVEEPSKKTYNQIISEFD